MDLKNQTQKRPIKFRAICAFSGVWRYGFYYVSKGNHIIRDENDKESIVLEKTLGQFTGLHDKNGKEIYEQMELNNIFIIKWLNFRYVLFYISNLTIFEEIFDYENKLEITREYTEL